MKNERMVAVWVAVAFGLIVLLALAVNLLPRAPSTPTGPCGQIIVQWSDLDVGGVVPLDCDLAYLRVTLNGKYRSVWLGADDGLLRPRLLGSFVTDKGERFNPFTTVVVKCEYVANSLPKQDCLGRYR